MSIVSVQPKSFILALFIRDDNERFLLGDNGYDFKDSQLHFAANTIENDEVQKQGADGVMVAGQVRRASVQSFDGFVGDATMAKETIEQMRRDFIAFFLKGHHYRVIYVDCNRNAWQRKGGYLVDAPEVKELWQIHPEYHVGLNFEDVNYYSYDEDADGNEILANLVNVPVSTEAEGGLVWDEDGAVSENAGDISYDEEIADATPAKNVYITDATEAPLASFQLDGKTSQQTYTGKNLLEYVSRFVPFSNYGLTTTIDATTGVITINGTFTSTTAKDIPIIDNSISIDINQSESYYIGIKYISGAKTGDSNFTARTVLDGGSYYWNNAVPLVHENRSVSCNITNAVRFDNVRFFVPVGSTFNNYKILPYLNHGATDYEPYVGGIASPNPGYPQTVNTVAGENVVKICGKNLFDSSATPDYVAQQAWAYFGNGTYTAIANGYYFESGYRAIAFEFDSLIVGQQYTLSFDAKGNSSHNAQVGVNMYSGASGGTQKNYTIETTSARISFTFTATSANRIAFNSGSTSGADLTITNIQLELGSTATAYEPYQGQSYTISLGSIELCKIGTYQDYIYKSGGKWYVRKECGKVILDGVNKSFSDRYTTVSSHYRFVYADQSIPNYTFGTVAQIYCNRLIGGTIGNTYNRIECIAYNDASHRLISYISSIEDSTLAAANTWLQSNPLDIVYILATPTDTEITNEALIAQLNALLTTARTYASTNNIFTITPNEQGTLEIGYYTKYQPMVGSGGYVWEAGGAGGPTVIMNNSIDSVSPVWTIYGPTTNPQLENATTGETIEYVGTIAQGQTLTIDMGEQTASLDGLNVISNLVGDFVQLAPGRNNIIYSVSGEAGASELGWSEIVG